MAKSAGAPKRSAPRRKTRRNGGMFQRAYRRLTGRASGGSVAAGVPYYVGERGPEVFVPTTPGRIQTIPGGTGRAAAMRRKVGSGLAALGRARRTLPKWSKGLILAGIAGIGTGLVTHAFDQMKLSAPIQGAIFGGLAVGLAVFGQFAAASAVLVVAAYELGAAGLAWFRERFANVLPTTASNGTTAAPAES